MSLSIVIVSYNARADLVNCLLSLKKAPPSIPHEIIVVDNDSQDDSVVAGGRPVFSNRRAPSRRSAMDSSTADSQKRPSTGGRIVGCGVEIASPVRALLGEVDVIPDARSKV